MSHAILDHEKHIDSSPAALDSKGLSGLANIHAVDDVDLSAYSYTEEESRAIARKFDWHILPLAWGCYLFNSLDRNNASNAKSAGLTSEYRCENKLTGQPICTFPTTDIPLCSASTMSSCARWVCLE